MNKKQWLTLPAKVALSFLGGILLGTFLLCLPISSSSGQWWSFIDALFTSTSAVCVTGLVVVDTAVHFSLFGQIVLLVLIQIGGLGFISMSVLLLLWAGKKLSFKSRMALQESLNRENSQGVVILLKKIAILVFSIEGIGFLLLLPSMILSYGTEGIFKAFFLSISAFCNAGFDILGTTGMQFQSLAPFAKNVFVLLPIMFLIVLGGLGYTVILEIIGKKNKEKRKIFTFHAKVVMIMTAVLICGGAILFAIFEWNNPDTIGNMSVFEKIMNSFFQSITPRTAGFATFDQANLTSSSRVVTDILMFIGGSPTSTAGGIKTTTIFVLMMFAFKSSTDKGDVIVNKKSISAKTVQKCLRLVALVVIIAISATVTICLLEKNNPLASSSSVIFEVLSAISTVGVTLGLTPTLGFVSKLIIISLMFVGRVGMLTIAFAIKHKSQDAYGLIQYPDSKINVG
ncbi:MAG: Trk family potassium uptake protein [Clostridia bacterium]|nr:Trk family potassium uptake protein [Clostridia bacterium]